MFRIRASFTAIPRVILGVVLLARPTVATAQHHSSGGGHGGYGLSGISRPDGVDEKDSLKDFHHALAVQATSEQVAQYQAVLKSTEAAKAELETLQQLAKAGKTPELPAHNTALDQALQAARIADKKFLDGFSAAQKSGLKEPTRRLLKADADLEQEGKKLDDSLTIAKAAGPDVSARAESVDKVLTDFYDQQLALGREMSIVLANGQDVTFILPKVKSPVSLGGQTIDVAVSGALSQTAVQGEQRTFRLELVSDLSDLQQNITTLLRAELDQSDLCGQRVAIRQASLTPSSPASLLVVLMHFERWTCNRSFGQQNSTELAESDGTVEVKLTAAVGEAGALKVQTQFGRIDAIGMMADTLRSGSLGEDLRDKASQLLLAAMRSGANSSTTLPPAVRGSATIQSAKFQDSGAGILSAVLGGQVQISNTQAEQLASQLNQVMSAQENSPSPAKDHP